MNRRRWGIQISLIFIMIFLIFACLPRLKKMGSAAISSDGEGEPGPVNRSEWSWFDGQGRTRSYEQTFDRIREIVSRNGIRGLSLVLKQAKLWTDNPDVFHLNLGFESSQSTKSIDAKTIFRADRLGQTVVAYLVLRLASDGQFDLDRSLSRYVAKSAMEGSFYKDIANDRRCAQLTARRILSHQSGLVNSRLNHPDKKLTFITSPGKGYAYSDEGFGYLQFILEQTLGRGLDELANAYVFGPFAMTQSKFSCEIHAPADSAFHPGDSKSGQPCAFFTTSSDFTNFMWQIRMVIGELPYEAWASYLIDPTVSVRSPSILTEGPYEGKLSLPSKLAWCLGWGIYRIPRVEAGACTFIGEKNQEMESYATVFYSNHSTAVTIFAVPSSSDSAIPLIFRELLGDMENPFSWLGF